MRIIFLTTAILTLTILKGQAQAYIDCETLSKRQLISIQEKYKDSAFFKYMIDPSTNKKTEVFSLVIDELSIDDIKALCIESWYDLKQNGFDYCYERFRRRYFKIDINQYKLDIRYLEILTRIDKILKDAK